MVRANHLSQRVGLGKSGLDKLGYSCSKTQCGTGGSRDSPVPVKGVQAIRDIAAIEILEYRLLEAELGKSRQV